MAERILNEKMRDVKLIQLEMIYLSGVSIARACKMAGISVHTYYKWKREQAAEQAEACADAAAE